MSQKHRTSKRALFRQMFALRCTVPIYPEAAILHLSPCGRIIVENAGAIKGFSPSCILVQFGTKMIEIRGEALQMESLKQHSLMIFGHVFSINLLYSKEAEKHG